MYQQFSRRADATMEIVDGQLALPLATAPAHLVLLPGFPRKWGSSYDALSAGRMEVSGSEDLVAPYPLDHGESVYVLDCLAVAQM